jgi:hypothetical protein
MLRKDFIPRLIEDPAAEARPRSCCLPCPAASTRLATSCHVVLYVCRGARIGTSNRASRVATCFVTAASNHRGDSVLLLISTMVLGARLLLQYSAACTWLKPGILHLGGAWHHCPERIPLSALVRPRSGFGISFCGSMIASESSSTSRSTVYPSVAGLGLSSGRDALESCVRLLCYALH